VDCILTNFTSQIITAHTLVTWSRNETRYSQPYAAKYSLK